MCCISPVYSLAQEVKTVKGEYTYYVPDNVTKKEAYKIALERLKIQLIADEFGTVVNQSNMTTVENKDGKSSVDFKSIGNSELRGEWLETIGEPEYITSYEQDMLVVRVKAKGRIREIVSASVDFKAFVLRNGTEDKYESDSFKSGDDLFLSFKSPVEGYVAVYLIDGEGSAYCLLPYQTQEQGNVKVNANERYVFFSGKQSTDDLRKYVEEYTMTCAENREMNQVYVIFSTNPFVKAVDDKREQSLPRSLSDVDFHKWLSSARAKDKAMVYKKLTITINK